MLQFCDHQPQSLSNRREVDQLYDYCTVLMFLCRYDMFHFKTTISLNCHNVECTKANLLDNNPSILQSSDKLHQHKNYNHYFNTI